MKAPFVYFGGKSSVAAEVWRRFGRVATYIEPFCGTCAVLLARPNEPKYETVNDANGFIANFWRALQCDPCGVYRHCDCPVNELDLHAWHKQLTEMAAQLGLAERVRADPYYFNVLIAGRWCWGQCNWIGSGWCNSDGSGLGRPHVGRPCGIAALSRQKPVLSCARGTVALSRQRPRLPHNQGTVSMAKQNTLLAYLKALAARLRHVSVCCGDWARVCTPAVVTHPGTPAGVFLDPPYSTEANRDMGLYGEHDCGQVAHAVREWAIENGTNPELRIALCGYEGEHVMPDDWECFEWKAAGGLANIGGAKSQGHVNRHRERIFFSPHCPKPARESMLF